MRIDRSISLTALLILLALILRVTLSFCAYKHFVDDAYIFMRYSENFASGNGLVYNPGEKVMGFTSVLYTVLVSLLKTIFHNTPTHALITYLNHVLFVISSVLLCLLLDRSGPLYYSTLIILLFYFPFVDAPLTGMETALFIVFLVGALLGIKMRAFTSACIFSALSVITRPEGVFILFPTLLLAYRRIPHKRFFSTVSVLLLIASLVAFSLLVYYGTFVPHSIIAKSSLTSASRWSGFETNIFQKAVLLVIAASDWFCFSLSDLARYALGTATIICLVVCTVGVCHLAGKRPELLVAGSFYIFTLAFYTLGKPVRIFSWYTIPTSICILLVFFWSFGYFLKKHKSNLFLGCIFAAIVLTCTISIFVALPRRLENIENHAGDLHQLALRLHRSYPQCNNLMIADIGIVGYASTLRIIDLAGLVSPEVMPHGNQNLRCFGHLVNQTEPDIICLKQNPLEKDFIIEGCVRYRSFDSADQRRSFLEKYEYTNLGSIVCPYVFLRK